jgi:hypothetical protein
MVVHVNCSPAHVRRPGRSTSVSIRSVVLKRRFSESGQITCQTEAEQSVVKRERLCAAVSLLLRNRNMRLVLRVLGAAACAVALWPTAVAAQTGGGFAAGPSFVTFRFVDDDVRDTSGYGVVTRIRGGPGWGPALEFPGFGTDIDTTIAGARVTFGHLRVWSVLGGVAYTVGDGPVSLSLSVLGGYAFNDISLADPARLAYEQRLGLRGVDVRIANAPAFKPGAALWLDVGPAVGLLASVGYLVLRPEITVLSDTGSQTIRPRADSVVLQAGIVFRIF